VIAAAPEFALALGFDLDAAFEAWNKDPRLRSTTGYQNPGASA
jgi:hypothetical protein